MERKKISVVNVAVILVLVSSLNACVKASESKEEPEGPHIRSLGYSGSIPEPKVLINEGRQKAHQRKQSKGETCDEDPSSCLKASRSSFSKSKNGFHARVGESMGSSSEPIHPGPLRIEIRNLNLKPIKNSTSFETGRSNIYLDYYGETMSEGFSYVVSFLFKALCSFIFVKGFEAIFGTIWNTMWKFAGWGEDYNTASVSLGLGSHPFAHYSKGWSNGNTDRIHDPYSFSYHDHAPHRQHHPTGNHYYPGNKYYAGSHADVKALKKAAKKKNKHWKKASKYWTGPIEHYYDKRKLRTDNLLQMLDNIPIPNIDSKPKEKRADDLPVTEHVPINIYSKPIDKRADDLPTEHVPIKIDSKSKEKPADDLPIENVPIKIDIKSKEKTADDLPTEKILITIDSKPKENETLIKMLEGTHTTTKP